MPAVTDDGPVLVTDRSAVPVVPTVNENGFEAMPFATTYSE